MSNCKYCSVDSIRINGDYTDIEINAKNHMLYAIGDDLMSIEIKYCPMCGRKLGD